MRMARSLQVDTVLLAMSQSIIAESRRLLASSWSERVNLNKHDVLLANSRVRVADSKRLLAALEAAAAVRRKDEARRQPITMPTTPATARAKTDPAALSVHVSQEGARFSWTVCRPSEEIVGWGTAETEVKARAEAFCAGMIYLDCVKHPPDDTNLH
jgi:hypothetical protein